MDIKKIIKKSVATVLTEASKERMIAQIERAEKEGTSIYKLPKATQDFYNKVYKKSANESINLKAAHLSSEDYQKAKKLKAFNSADWTWNSKSHLYDKVNESIVTESQDAYTLSRLADNVGQGTAEEFLSKYNVNLKLLVKAIQQKTITKYELRDIINGSAHKLKLKKFKSEFVNESVVNEGNPPTDATIKPNMSQYSVSDDPYDVAEELGKKYGWSQKQIEKAEKLIRKKYIKESVTESKFFRLPSKLNVMWDLKNSVNAMVSKHDSGDDYDPAVMKTIEDLIKKIKKSAKAFNSAEDVKGTLYETSLRKVFNATKKGNFPVTLVAIENGKVVDQKLVGTREIVPAAFNEMQREFPKAQVNVEDRTGKILFRESINEAVEPQIQKVAELTGVAIDRVEKYVSSRTLNITALLKYIKDEKQVAIRDFEKAVKGDKKQDAYFIKMFNESVVTEATKDLWGSNALVSINSIKKYLKAMKSGVTIHLNKKISYTKVEANEFTSDKYTDLGLDQLANVMDQAFKKKQKVQVEESSINKTIDTKVE
tara:strand:+ start:355 stop:1977 length:1623 start_codon:yes stop_codon:yes gene_type:complete